MRVMLRPRRLRTLPLGLLDETAHLLSFQRQRRLFPVDIVGDIIVYGVRSRRWFRAFFIFVD